MAESPHFKQLLQLLNELKVRYLIVGGYAVMKYSEPRYTKDLDIWIEASTENSARVFEALQKFGAPLESDGISAQTFTDAEITYQIGIAPLRIDISRRLLALISHLRGMIGLKEVFLVLLFTSFPWTI